MIISKFPVTKWIMHRVCEDFSRSFPGSSQIILPDAHLCDEEKKVSLSVEVIVKSRREREREPLLLFGVGRDQVTSTKYMRLCQNQIPKQGFLLLLASLEILHFFANPPKILQ